MCKRFTLVLMAVLVLSLFPSAATLALRAPLPAQLPPTGTGGEPPPALVQAGVTAGAWQRIGEQIRADQAQSGCSECASTWDWSEEKKLLASDGAANDDFGSSVATWGDTVVVGAYGDDIGSNADQGSAYLFGRNQGGADHWGQIIKLTASDGAGRDEFGYSVAISGDAVVVGANYDDIGSNANQGSAYLFVRNQGGADHWGQLIKLTASDGAAGDEFGWSVAISDDTVVVGANYDDIGSNANQGSAYLFGRNQGGADNWGQIIKLTASDGAGADDFGWSVALSGDTVVVGAAYDDIGSNADQGSAYLFARDQGGVNNWGQLKKLTAADGAAEDAFGVSLAIWGDTVVVGAFPDDIGSNFNQGSAYLFARNQGGADHWGQLIKLTASDGAAYDYFGFSVAISGDTVVLGAIGDDIGSNSGQGSAYVFGGAQPLPGDLDGDCDVDIVDIMLVAARWGTSQGQPNYDLRYDVDGDGDIDIVDIMRVAAHWGQVCPT